MKTVCGVMMMLVFLLAAVQDARKRAAALAAAPRFPQPGRNATAGLDFRW